MTNGGESKRKRPNPTTSQIDAKKPRIELAPALLVSSPIDHGVRVQHLKAINEKLGPNSIEFAVALEKETAQKSTSAAYRMNIRNLIRAIVRGDYKDDPDKVAKQEAAEKLKYRNELEKLVIPREKLEKRYIMQVDPQEYDIDSDRFNCERCGAEVTTADIALMLTTPNNTITCKFHPMKRVWDPATRKLSLVLPCCNEILGTSNGCTTNKSHVIKLKEPYQLDSIEKFITIPEAENTLFAAGIDCEMAFTTFGFELIRVTVVDWDTGKTVLDRTVWPKGTVIDLNTKFSGVSDLNEGLDLDGVHYDTITFNQARKELFKYISKSTILIGHGFENDLNVMRLIHERIVDTAMLYPRHHPRTHSLKQLAWTYLSRTIQTGQHDSAEDSIAAIDIVKADIKRILGI